MKLRLINLLIYSACLFSSASAEESFRKKDVSEDFFLDSYMESCWWPWNNEENSKENLNPFNSEKVIDLERKLQERIVGQEQAIKLTVSALERYVHGINDPHAPIASLLYMGPSGVGKTQLAKELAKILLGGEQYLIRFNMAEFSDHQNVLGSISRLIGMPPAYSNSNLAINQGELTEALRKNPYSIVLLDEIEKADPAVLKIFLQLFDEGFISNSRGNLIDCRNAIFILSTNLGSQKILTMHDLGHSDQEIIAATQPAIMNAISPEVYNRLEPVVFRGLKQNVLDELISKLLNQATEELVTKRQIVMDCTPSVIHFLKMHAADYQLGARPFKHLIKQTIMTAITEAIKQKYLKNGDQAIIDFQDHSFIIQNVSKNNPFVWHWSNEPQGIQPPFNLESLIYLESKLQQKVLGQPYAIKLTVAALMRYAAGLANAKSPIGSFLYVGPTGVGKTQLAKELAAELMGSEHHLIRLDMSEYSDSRSISRLIGSPPGYINHENGGQLTEALKQHPYAIVLLDEIEKAHPVVLKTFLQIFDEGRISDAQGAVIDCRNVIFISTTNLAAAKILSMHEKGSSKEDILKAIKADIISIISPELYNRMEVAPFMGLSSELLDQLIQNMLRDVQQEIRASRKIEVQFDSSLIDFLKRDGYDYELGARPLKRLIQQTIITAIAKEIITKNIHTDDTIKLFYCNDEIIIKKESL